MSELASKHCQPCEGGVPPLSRAEAHALLKQLNSRWTLAEGTDGIDAKFTFPNYFRTTAFINAVAWIAHREDHHPDISFGYDAATIHFSTHSVGGLSHNDFICAAKIDALVAD